jgi:hypothetical protein
VLWDFLAAPSAFKRSHPSFSFSHRTPHFHQTLHFKITTITIINENILRDDHDGLLRNDSHHHFVMEDQRALLGKHDQKLRKASNHDEAMREVGPSWLKNRVASIFQLVRKESLVLVDLVFPASRLLRLSPSTWIPMGKCPRFGR